MCALVLLYARRLKRQLHTIRTPYKLHKVDLNPPSLSAWARINVVNSDRGHMFYTTFTKHGFDTLYELVYPQSEAPPAETRGRPCLLTKRDNLAMTCFWLHSVASLNMVASLFNCPPSTCSRNILAVMARLHEVLPHVHEARIQWPSDIEATGFARLILANMLKKGNTGEHVNGLPFAFMDGCNLPVLRHEDTVVQDKFYALWKSCHTVSNLFVWAPDGTIIHANYNVPGAVHDSTIANEAYHMLGEMHPSFTILADSAFKRQGGRVVTTQTREITAASAASRKRNKQIASQRVAAEWGNAGLQAAWVRLTTPLTTHDQHRRRIIAVCLHLHNFRTRVVDINQIRTVYDKDWVGNWRRRAGPHSRLERYVEAVRMRVERNRVVQQRRDDRQQQR